MQEQDSKINEESVEGIPSYLGSLHSGLPTQVAVHDSRWKTHNPICSVENSPTIHFRFSSSEDEVLDLASTVIKLETKILDIDGNEVPEFEADGTTPVTNNECLLVNCLNSSMFKNVEVKINNTTVSQTTGLYHYRADFENRLFTTVDQKNGFEMEAAGFIQEDVPFESTTNASLAFAEEGNTGANRALKQRYLQQRGSKTYMTQGKIHSEIFDQLKYFPPKTVIDVILEKNTDAILMMTKRGPGHRVAIKKCVLDAHYVIVDTEILADIDFETMKGLKLRYPIRRVDMSYHTKSGGSSDLSIFNLFKAGVPLPRRLFMAIVPQKSFRGSIDADPFNYRDFSTKEVTLLVDGQAKPYIPLKMGDNEMDYLTPLSALQRAVRGNEGTEENGITLQNYRHRNFFMGWDLTASGLATGESYELPLYNSVDLVYLLKETLPFAVTMIFYAEYDAEVRIDKDGSVELLKFAL